MSRVCSICKAQKELADFESMPKKPLGRGYRCTECNRKRARDRYRGLMKEQPVKECCWCGSAFNQRNSKHIHCSTSCRNHASFKGNRHKYITSLLNRTRREQGLTREDIEQIWEKQNGKCALSGVSMTMIRGSGRVPTNCSIDRIEAGGAYHASNVQLVCSHVNSFREDLSIDEYIEWCRKVVSEQGKAAGGRKSRK